MHCAAIFDFVCQYQANYKALPVDTTIRATYGDNWQPVPGAFDYWFDQFQKTTIARKAQKAMLAAMEGLGSDPGTALTSLIQDLSTIRITGNERIQASDAAIGQRYERYLMRKAMYEESNGEYVAGLKTAFNVINDTKIGWIPGELIGLYSRPSVGKTWLLSYDGVLQWMDGKRVAFFSPEMPAGQIALRFDVLMAYQLGIDLSHRLLFSGSPAMDVPYHELVTRVAPNERWLTVDSVDTGLITTADIRRTIEQFNPDIVYVDGISLLGNPKRTEWEGMKENMYALKSIATYFGIPIFVSHQAARAKRGGKEGDADSIGKGDDYRMPTLNDVAFGDAFIAACSTIITSCADQERGDVRWYSVRKMRDREFIKMAPRYGIYVDYDHGHIEDVSQFGGDKPLILQQIDRIRSASKWQR